MVIVVQYNILKIFLLCTSVKLIKLILYFIIVLLMNKRDLHLKNTMLSHGYHYRF